jgi:hypothetical protein
VSFGGNAESAADFVEDAVNPTSLAQAVIVGGANAGVGAQDTDGAVEFKAVVNDPEGMTWELQVEVQPVGTAGFLNAITYPGSIQGTADDAASSTTLVEITIQRASDGFFFDGAAWGAGATFLAATGTTAWTRAFTPADGETYAVSSRATDAAGNVEASLGTGTFTFDTTGPVSAPSTSGAVDASTYPGAI